MNMNKLLYIIVGLITLVGFMLAMVPARFLLSQIAGELQPIELGRVDGRIWSGSAEIRYHQFPATLSWELAVLPLFLGRVSTDVEVQADGLDMNFRVSANWAGGSVSGGNVVLDAHYINRVSLEYGLDLSGQFTLTDAELVWTDNWLDSARGQLDWSGGRAQIETPWQVQVVDLPALQGELSMEDRNLLLQVLDADSELMKLRLKPDGWGEMVINYAFMEMVGLPLPGNLHGRGNEPAVVLEEKIL